MKALSFDGSLKLIRNAPLPVPNGEALVQVLCAGICNTDLEITKGYASFHGILGHEFVGRVVESDNREFIGRRVVGEINAGCGKCGLCRAGDPRHCPERTVLGIKGRDGAFAEYLSLPTENLFEVPDSIADRIAVLVEPLAAACQILTQISLTPSTAVAIIGDGKLAQLIARVVATRGCTLTLVGKHEHKLELARRSGARCLMVDEAIGLLEGTADRPEVVIEATGSPTGLSLALSLVRPRGAIVLKSTHHRTTPIQLSQLVVNEVSIVGSRCGRFKPALDLLSGGSLELDSLISCEMTLDEGVAAFERASKPETMKVLIHVGN